MMASAFDVAGRLSEGEQALTVLDDYVAACQVLGLPTSASLPDLYRTESGLDLAALAADARSLDAAATAAQDALRMQGNGYRELTAQWSGAGGAAAGEFMRALTVGAEDVVAHLRRSAQALTALRDDLWRAVDTKVDAVLRADAQAAGHRDEWSAAARAVLAGAGDMAAASELIDQQVKPFVVRVVSGDLLPALRDASDAVAAAYDSAIVTVTPATVSFAVPFAMTPQWAPSASSLPGAEPVYQAVAAAPFGTKGAAAAAPFGTLGTAAGWTPSPAPVTAEPAPAPAIGTSGVPEPALGAPAATPAAAGLPGDLGLGSGIGSLGQQLTDAIGGALGSMAGLAPGASGLGGLDRIRDGLGGDLGSNLGADTDDTDTDSDVDHDADDEPNDEPDDDPNDEPEDNDAEGAEDPAAEGGDAESDDADSGPVDTPAAPLPQPFPDQSADDPASTIPPAEPLAEQGNPTTRTPCEIAADELPNVGE